MRFVVGCVALRAATSSAHARADLGGVARLEPVLDARDDLPVPELRVPVREPELGRRQPARSVARSTTSARTRIAVQSLP